MEKTEKNQKAEEKSTLMGFYFGFVFIILNLILRVGFSIEYALAFSVAILITASSAYPLFIRGAENPWRKGKQWTFLTWLIVCVIPFSVLAFLLISLVDWLISG